MKTQYFTQKLTNQFLISIISVIAVTVICYFSSGFIGYRTVALLLLATVSILAIFFTLYPVLLAATLSALSWDFFFIPPHFTLHIQNSEDFLMLLMYFVIALINGILTSKVRQFEKTEHQKEERKNALKLYKTLFDSVSHELRTPIATIVGASDNLINDSEKISSQNKTELLKQISISAFRLNRLIDNLLNIQRLESGLLKPKFDWYDINELFNTILNRLSNELSNHLVKLEIENDFPLIKLDAGLLDQAISNILINASFYTPLNSTITINVFYKAGVTTITISDEGKGFPPDKIDKVFEKFYRFDQKKTGGTGLGLSISKGFVEAHNGSIKVENIQNGGAKFTIIIPTEIYRIDENVDFNELGTKIPEFKT